MKKDSERKIKYQKENYKWLNIQFNETMDKDKEISTWLNTWPKAHNESRAKYIKRLIQEDMKKHSGE